jgi:pimeloyl-ACP methyl ester carboxylesterase
VSITSLHVEEAGHGSPVVLIHAGIADSRMWDRQMGELSEHHRVIRYDLAGFGRSPWAGGPFSNVRDLRDLLDSCGVERATVVGCSFGGRVALELAFAHPERVSALVLIAPGLRDYDWSEEVTRFGEEEEAAVDRGDLDAAVELNLRLWVDGPRRGPGAVDPAVRAFVGEMQRDAFRVQLAAFAEDPPPGPEEPLEGFDPSRVEAPTLVLVGDEDVTDMLEIAKLLEREMPNARRVVLPGVAHLPSLERPAEVNRLVLEFLAEAL